jgi:endonuclease G
LDPRFRSKLTDYRGSGYDRGHMAPAANHKASQATMDETFVLSNTSPQVGQGFNRDMWARLERFVYELRDSCTDVFVVSGPLYLPQRRGPRERFVLNHDMIGERGEQCHGREIIIIPLLLLHDFLSHALALCPSRIRCAGVPPQLVAVPTHFYKVVLGEVRPAQGGAPARVAIGAFVMPNQPIEPDAPLASFVVPISALEDVSGIQFFPKYLNHGERRAALDQASLAVQRQGQSELRRLHPGGPAPALLPAPEGPAALLPPPRAGGLNEHGAMHLCDLKACRLPPPNWWEAGKAGRGKLRRTKSSPAL